MSKEARAHYAHVCVWKLTSQTPTW
ncbi:hypothetical protein LINPERPRIM_LOCUS37373 [Linum perenne]